MYNKTAPYRKILKYWQFQGFSDNWPCADIVCPYGQKPVRPPVPGEDGSGNAKQDDYKQHGETRKPV